METTELSKLDLKKLEGYIANFDKYKRDLKFREFLIMENHEPENAEGGKSNMTGRPVENEVIKKNADKKYRHLCDVVNGVQRLLDNSDDDTLEMIRLRYWDCPIGATEWKDIAAHFYVSEASIYRRRVSMLTELAKYIGYV
ncbi:transcriptional regulator [Mammaliicoccus sciuri]|uniref:transcriptional regulator n=1 Tax=Mammaliicoccus sciuri TaxID=1296 RepID=UPI00397DFCC5